MGSDNLTVMTNVGCRLGQIWNWLKPKHLGKPENVFFIGLFEVGRPAVTLEYLSQKTQHKSKPPFPVLPYHKGCGKRKFMFFVLFCLFFCFLFVITTIEKFNLSFCRSIPSQALQLTHLEFHLKMETACFTNWTTFQLFTYRLGLLD